MLFITNESQINIKDNLLSLYFYSKWMPFHKKMLGMIDKVENKHRNIEFLAIDVDDFKNICKRFEVKCIPTVLVMKSAKEIKRIEGLPLTSAFKNVFIDI